MVGRTGRVPESPDLGRERPRTKLVRSRTARTLYIGAGHLFVGMGVVGIFAPLWPTTPFLILAAACYARGSERLHSWLLSNRMFGKLIRDYQEGRGMPLRARVVAIAMLWSVMALTMLFAVTDLALRAVETAVGVGVTILIATRGPRRGAPAE